MNTTRRGALATMGLLAAGGLDAGAQAVTASRKAEELPNWPKGFEGQRKADMGSDFLNPIFAGDHPDPSILRDGDDYYMTFSTFETYPGLLIWHSRDLINWQPVTTALTTNIGSVWAPELCKHAGRFYIYIPTRKTAAPGSKTTSWVIWADSIKGPWSEPIDLDLPNHIDPGHAVGEDGSRWLFLSDGDRVLLAPDGLSRIGEPEHVFDAWRFPNEWDVEGFSPEGPKVLHHGDYFYLILAEGGTAGPPTGHMVVAARSRSINGPWEHHPRNPLVRTTDRAEKWWSRGHATLVEGPSGDWWGVYHGYENGFYTLGRQTLLAPVTWAKDGWFDFEGGDLSKPLAKPKGGRTVPHGLALSDDFSTDKYGLQWSFFSPSLTEAHRISRRDRTLHLEARGSTPADSSPLLFAAGDQAYEFECQIDADPAAGGGLLLYYDDRLYCGLNLDGERFQFHKYGATQGRSANLMGRRLWMRLRNDRHVVSFHLSRDGQTWERFIRGVEVSGYHHNVRGGFMALKPGLFATGSGEVRFRDFRYRALWARTAPMNEAGGA